MTIAIIKNGESHGTVFLSRLEVTKQKNYDAIACENFGDIERINNNNNSETYDDPTGISLNNVVCQLSV